MSDLLPTLSQFVQTVSFDVLSTMSNSTDQPNTVAPPDDYGKHHGFLLSKDGSPILDMIATRQQRTEFSQHINRAQILLKGEYGASVSRNAFDRFFANVGQMGAELAGNGKQAVNATTSDFKTVEAELGFLSEGSAILDRATDKDLDLSKIDFWQNGTEQKPAISVEKSGEADIRQPDGSSELMSDAPRLSGISVYDHHTPQPGEDVASKTGRSGGDLTSDTSSHPKSDLSILDENHAVRTDWADFQKAQLGKLNDDVFRNVLGQKQPDENAQVFAQANSKDDLLQPDSDQDDDDTEILNSIGKAFRDIYGLDAAKGDIDRALEQIRAGTSLEQYRWDEAHSDEAINAYKDIYRAVHGRDASETDMAFAASKVGNGTSLQDYRWDEAHNPEAMTTTYRNIFRDVHGRDASQADVDFAAAKVGNGASLQQYRWDEAHNSEAITTAYKNIFWNVHGRAADDGDVAWAAEKVGNGTSLQQYRWDEAHNDEAMAAYRKIFNDVHGRDPSKEDIDWAADLIGYGVSIHQYRYDEAHNPEALSKTFKELLESVHGREVTFAEILDAAERVGKGASLQQLRREEAHNDEAMATYRKIFQEIHGREAEQADLDTAATLVSNGFSLQQYRDYEKWRVV